MAHKPDMIKVNKNRTFFNKMGYWISFFRMKLKNYRYTVIGDCKICGQCCKELCLKIAGRWTKSEKEFREMVEDNPEYARFHILEKDLNGFLWFYCDKLGPDGKCMDYEDRPNICSDYPKASLKKEGAGELPKGCGYKIVKAIPFEKYLDLEMQNRK